MSPRKKFNLPSTAFRAANVDVVKIFHAPKLLKLALLESGFTEAIRVLTTHRGAESFQDEHFVTKIIASGPST